MENDKYKNTKIIVSSALVISLASIIYFNVKYPKVDFLKVAENAGHELSKGVLKLVLCPIYFVYGMFKREHIF